MSAVNSLPSSTAMQFTPPTAEQRAYEPSMEEILASIRRIIADDQSLPNRASPGEDAARHNAHADGGQTAGTNQPQQLQANQAPQANQASKSSPIPVQPAPSADAFTGAPASVTMLHHVLQGRRVEALVADHAPFDPDAGQDAHLDHQDMLEHGHIAAPQFATPAGPESYPQDQDHEDAYDDAQVDPGADTQVDVYEASDDEASALFSSETDRSVTGAFNTLAATRLADNSEDLLGLAREMIRPLLKSWLDDNLPGMVERMVRAEIERVARGGR